MAPTDPGPLPDPMPIPPIPPGPPPPIPFEDPPPAGLPDEVPDPNPDETNPPLVVSRQPVEPWIQSAFRPDGIIRSIGNRSGFKP